MNAKGFGLFCGGLLIGATSSFVVCWRYFKKKYEADRDQLEGYYKEVDKYARIDHDDEEDENDVNPSETDAPAGGRMNAEERALIKKKLQENHRKTTNYAGMYREKNSEAQEWLDDDSFNEEVDEEDIKFSEESCRYCWRYRIADSDNPAGFCSEHRDEFDYQVIENDCPAFLHYKDVVENEEEAAMFEEHQKNKGKGPRIISGEAYSNLPGNIDQSVMYFYAEDQVLTDENGDPIEDPERYVGNCLIKYDFVDSDEHIIFVLNNELNSCYEIQKLDQAWADSTHAID